jgi:hypothetical protein
VRHFQISLNIPQNWNLRAAYRIHRLWVRSTSAWQYPAVPFNCLSYIVYCRQYCRSLPSVLPDIAALYYNPAVKKHQASSHDCRLLCHLICRLYHNVSTLECRPTADSAAAGLKPSTCQVPGKMSGSMMPLMEKKTGIRPAPPGICVRCRRQFQAYGRHFRIFAMPGCWSHL